jgi:hypothetical protein
VPVSIRAPTWFTIGTSTSAIKSSEDARAGAALRRERVPLPRGLGDGEVDLLGHLVLEEEGRTGTSQRGAYRSARP